MRRLGKNHGAYHGETIDVARVLASFAGAARARGWRHESLPVSERVRLPTLTRTPASPRKTIYLSTGIHGDEPAGPLAALRLLDEDRWPADVAIHFCPCLNPEGFRLNRRENEDGVDLNRDYKHLTTAAIRAHVAWIDRQPRFDVALCLHEDWEAHGFYLYELNPDGLPSIAEPIVRRVAPVCPIDLSPVIEGRAAAGGIIRPSPDPESRPQWPEAFYLFQHKTRLSYTLEAPSDFPLPTRVAALVEGVHAMLEHI